MSQSAFFSRIVEKEFKLLKRIQNREKAHPIVLYGASRMAEIIYTILFHNKIDIDIVAVDSMYYDEKLFFGKPVMLIEDVIKIKNIFDYVIAFRCPNEQKFEKLINADTIFTTDISLDMSELAPDEGAFEFYASNQNSIAWLAENLCDDMSRDTLAAFINQRISGDLSYLKPFRCPNQYFADGIIKLDDEEVFIDCGAFVGDTIDSFYSMLTVNNINCTAKFYAIEPDIENYRLLEEKYKNHPSVEMFNLGVGDQACQLKMVSTRAKTESSFDAERLKGDWTVNEQMVRVDTIDNLLHGGKASFIKMDIEGFELKALLGAQKTIKEYAPRLAICIYHRPEDPWTIAKAIKKIDSSYKLYIRSHSNTFYDLVLYAVKDA